MVQDGVDARGLIEGVVGLEGQAGGVAQLHLLAELAAQEAGSVVQRRDHRLRVAAAQRHDEGGGALEVWADPHFRHRQVDAGQVRVAQLVARRSEEHTSELQSLMRISYAVFCLKKKKP